MKAVRKTSLILLLLLVMSSTKAGGIDSIPTTQTQLELNEKACAAYKKADTQMNKIYRRILSENGADKLFVQKMRAAQRAWIVFRDAHLEAMYPAADKRAAYGTVNPMCQCMELEKLTDERVRVLQQWVSGIEEGDVCGGSIKVKE